MDCSNICQVVVALNVMGDAKLYKKEGRLQLAKGQPQQQQQRVKKKPCTDIPVTVHCTWSPIVF